MATSPEEQMATMAANLKANTGKTLEEWSTLVRKSIAPAGRLEAAGSWNAMVTHRVRLESVADVDKELVGWLREAYMAA